jgi:hypothetical protein
VVSRFGFNWDVKGDKQHNYVVDLEFYRKTPFCMVRNQVSGADDGFFQIMDKDFKWPQAEK